MVGQARRVREARLGRPGLFCVSTSMPKSVPGQKAKYSLGADVFRFAPESGLKSDIAPCPKGATRRLAHRNKHLFDHLVGAGE
jgi:hypothetical protein